MRYRSPERLGILLLLTAVCCLLTTVDLLFLYRQQQCDTLGGDHSFLANRPERFARFALETDLFGLDSDDICDSLAHRLAMGQKSRPLQVDDTVDIPNR